jgi:hypothetical protein
MPDPLLQMVSPLASVSQISWLISVLESGSL